MKHLLLILLPLFLVNKLMAQPELINHLVINDTLYLEHFCTKSTKSQKEWKTILHNSTSGKKLELNKYELSYPEFPKHLKTNRYIQVFETILHDKCLYTLVYNYGIISLNCYEFSAPTTFKETIYPIISNKLYTFSIPPFCIGSLIKIDNDLYICLDISERGLNMPIISGIFKLSQNKQIYDVITPLIKGLNFIGIYEKSKVYKKRKEEWPKPDMVVMDKIYPEEGTFDDVNIDKNNLFVASVIKNLLMEYLPYDYRDSFEYLGYITNRVSKKLTSEGQHFTSIYFFYKINNKINYIEYVKQMNKNTQFWLSKEMILSPVEYTNEITQMYGK